MVEGDQIRSSLRELSKPCQTIGLDLRLRKLLLRLRSALELFSLLLHFGASRAKFLALKCDRVEGCQDSTKVEERGEGLNRAPKVTLLAGVIPTPKR